MKRLAFLPIAALALGACQDATQPKAPVLPAQFRHATTPSFGGTYNVLGFVSEAEPHGTLNRTTFRGSATFNTAARTFALSFQEKGAKLTEFCDLGDICTRSFTLIPVDQMSPVFSGTYMLTENNQVEITVTGESGETETVVGYRNPSGAIMILPMINEQFGVLGLLIFTKQGSDLSPSIINGTFNFADFVSSLNGISGPITTSWPGPLTSLVGSGTAVFSNGTGTVTENESAMTQETVTCTPIQAGGCTITATLQDSPELFSFALSVSVAADGTITFIDVETDEVSIGTISADGNFLLVDAGGDAGIIIATREGSGMSNASLNRPYNIIAFADNLNTSGDINTNLNTGTATFDGAGNVNFALTETRVSRTEGCNTPEGCAISVDVSTFEVSGTASYTVSANGQVTIDGAAVESITGVLSPDASFILLTTGFDNDCTNGGCDSERVLIIGVKAPAVHPLPDNPGRPDEPGRPDPPIRARG